MSKKSLETNVVIQGDCIEILKSFPDKSVDLIFADPTTYNSKVTCGGQITQKYLRSMTIGINMIVSQFMTILQPNGLQNVAVYSKTMARFGLSAATTIFSVLEKSSKTSITGFSTIFFGLKQTPCRISKARALTTRTKHLSGLVNLKNQSQLLTIKP